LGGYFRKDYDENNPPIGYDGFKLGDQENENAWIKLVSSSVRPFKKQNAGLHIDWVIRNLSKQ